MDFGVRSTIRFGWETFKTRPWFFVGTSIIIFIAYGIVGAITNAIDAIVGATPEDPSAIGGIINFVLSTFVGMGVTAFYLAAHDNPETVDISALWHPQPFWKYLGAAILVGFTIVIGFVLLIIPGIIAAIFFMFTTFIVIDKELGPIEAMKESMRIGRGYRWPLLGLIVLLSLIMLLGLIALFVGLWVAMPVASLAFVHAYRTLSGTTGPSSLAADARLAA